MSFTATPNRAKHPRETNQARPTLTTISDRLIEVHGIQPRVSAAVCRVEGRLDLLALQADIRPPLE
jgi:hypothetical protein